jgi:hypothetical protein
VGLFLTPGAADSRAHTSEVEKREGGAAPCQKDVALVWFITCSCLKQGPHWAGGSGMTKTDKEHKQGTQLCLSAARLQVLEASSVQKTPGGCQANSPPCQMLPASPGVCTHICQLKAAGEKGLG